MDHAYVYQEGFMITATHSLVWVSAHNALFFVFEAALAGDIFREFIEGKKCALKS